MTDIDKMKNTLIECAKSKYPNNRIAQTAFVDGFNMAYKILQKKS